MSYIVTEYKENVKNAQFDNSQELEVLNGFTNEVSYSEDYSLDNSASAPHSGSGGSHIGPFGSDDDAEYQEGELPDNLESGAIDLPGAGLVSPAEDEEVEEPKETNWHDDRDPKHFMVYILDMYPSKIPKHDGMSTLGCERAVHFLNKLNKEISEALRADVDNVLDIGKLEEIRTNMVSDVLKLQNHVKDLNKKRKSKKAEEEVELVKESETNKEEEINKIASTPIIQLVMTPFERAITGIILNATVSAGRPLEDVYAYLKDKYSIDDREELSIMQLLKDMGHPLFKDRGTFGKPEKKDEKAQGVDFIKNYFA